MLRLTGRRGDGWLPSLGGHYASPDDVPRMQAAIDESAKKAGRDPADIERAVNVMEPAGDDLAERLARIAGDLRFTTLLVGVPEEGAVDFVKRLGEDVAPRARELVG
jgi:alkanesulfonate monooxygenase SsuD/methylene tetrahydromethanopterin reductase-like flavin-dependent oxidoreductase (luciferase family)